MWGFVCRVFNTRVGAVGRRRTDRSFPRHNKESIRLMIPCCMHCYSIAVPAEFRYVGARVVFDLAPQVPDTLLLVYMLSQNNGGQFR